MAKTFEELFAPTLNGIAVRVRLDLLCWVERSVERYANKEGSKKTRKN